MSQSDFTRDRRDKKLWGLLPPKDAPYDCHKLSEVETVGLLEALGDGFGDVLVHGREPMPLPTKVTSGLLVHSFFCPSNSEYDDEWDDAFWSRSNGDDAPSPYEVFPLGFNRRRLGVYFRNQFTRFCEQVAGERAKDGWGELDRSEDKWIVEYLASKRLYEKPWYEFHALQFLHWMEDQHIGRHPGLSLLANTGFAGQLGRLVEQYYWRFRFEKAAITGAGARKGASAGGKAKAVLHQAERAAWQKAASEVWARRADLSKIAVAEQIRKRFGAARTAKHIARNISHP